MYSRLAFTLTAIFAVSTLSAATINIVTQFTNIGGANPLGYYAPYGAVNNPGVGAVSWTQTQGFQNVTLAADLFQVFQGQTTAGTVDYYVTNQIGAGATTANVFASGSVSLPYSPSSVMLGTVFILGPGTYYLVIDSPSPNTSWLYQFPGPASVTTAPSVTFQGDYSSRGGGVNTTFSPASSFGQYAIPFDFSVTATNATPEPGTVLLTGTGAALLLVSTRKKRKLT